MFWIWLACLHKMSVVEPHCRIEMAIEGMT